MLLVTGGAGFIGANFVIDWLSAIHDRHDEPVVVLDALTYAGNLGNLRTLQGDSRLIFVRGDITDRALVSSLCRHISRGPSFISPLKATSTVLFTARAPSYALTSRARSPCWRLPVPGGARSTPTAVRLFAFCMCPPMRFTARLHR